ncbi:MAG: DUF2860 family protein, partial [Desulfobacterales bacterium]
SSEKSGESLPLLTSSDRDRLKRDGDQHSAEILYRFNFEKRHQLAPAFTYSYDDRDGGAMKNDAYNFQLTYLYLGDPISLNLNALIGWADYDKRNPIFGKTREDDNYGLQGTLYYKNPWGWSLFGSKPMNFYIGAAYAKTDANIDFYDQEAILTTAGVFFKW